MIKRKITDDILEGARYFPVIGILGPRQSGKTTLARELFKTHTYLSLEELDLRTMAKNDPRTFLQANHNANGIIIDEFQYVPELLSYIQTIVDAEQIPGRRFRDRLRTLRPHECHRRPLDGTRIVFHRQHGCDSL